MNKKRSFLFLFILCLVLLSACHQGYLAGSAPAPRRPDSSPAHGKIDHSLAEDLVVRLKNVTQDDSDDLTAQFYRFYNKHTYELSMLPEFAMGHTPAWDELTLYAYINNAANCCTFSGSTISKQALADTLIQYFGTIEYTDRSSAYLAYENGQYTVIDRGPMRKGYYRLASITVDAAGVYEATFDALFFGELELYEDYDDASANIRAIRDEAGVEEPMNRESFEDTVLQIFLKDDYSDILRMSEKAIIQFRLSGNEESPFNYLFCSIKEY